MSPAANLKAHEDTLKLLREATDNLRLLANAGNSVSHIYRDAKSASDRMESRVRALSANTAPVVRSRPAAAKSDAALSRN